MDKTSSLSPVIEVRVVGSTDDLAALVGDIASVTWDDANEITPSDYTEQSLRNFVEAPRTVLMAAYVDGSFAGMLNATIQLHPHTTGQWLYVDELDTAVEYRRQGVAGALMDAAEVYAQQQDCYEVSLGADADNAPANAFYKQRKPSETEEVVWYGYELDDEDDE